MNDIIYYTFLAGWCAESAGARIEFRKTRFTDLEVFNAMHMTGESTSGIYPGQITDDSEMEMSLFSALIEGRHDEYFPLERIAEKYIEWYKSHPFDIGQTTAFALSEAKNACDILTNSHEYNIQSESNGSLMRCIPLAVFGINKSNETIFMMASMESELTHPNNLLGEITGIYCCIIAEILRNRINNINIDNTNYIEKLVSYIKTSKIKDWFDIGCNLCNLDNYDCIANEGHVKHAFIFFVYFLHNINNYTYEDAIFQILKCGGDTDTNAKIIGNLFGAYYGNCVPSYMTDIVLSFDATTVEHPFFRRPYKYTVNNAIKMISQIQAVGEPYKRL